MSDDFERKKVVLYVSLPLHYGFDSVDVEDILPEAGLDPITPENIDEALKLVKDKFLAAMIPPF